MRISALSATVALVAATLAGGGQGTVLTIDLEAGTAALHHNTARVTYERVDGAVNTFRIITVEAFSGERDCVWVEWNEPDGWNNGWSALNSEPPCHGGNLLQTPDRIITAPKDHPLKVRLVAYHDNAVDIFHKDIAKL